MELHNPDAWWRKLLWQPLSWGVACLVIAVSSSFAMDKLALTPPILAIIGGGICGIGIHALIVDMRSPQRGVLVHIVLAATFALVLFGVVQGGKELWRALPHLVREPLFLLTLAAFPATARLWLGLLARVLALRWGRPKPEPVAAPVPKWKLSDKDAVLRFSGIPMRMRTLTLLIGASVLLTVVAAFCTLIALDGLLFRLGPRLAIVLMAGAYGIPVYFLVTRAIRRQTRPCVVCFKPDRMRIEWGSHYCDQPYEQIRMLRWRCESDYARVEVWGHKHTISLMRGTTDPRRAPVRQLPELPDGVLDWLARAGLRGAAPRLHKLTTLRR